MGGVDVGSEGGKKRSTNAEINMIPFIDLLMVTIAFLLITAVWVTNSRINADAQVPGPPDPNKELTPTTPEKVLNLHIGESEFGDRFSRSRMYRKNDWQLRRDRVECREYSFKRFTQIDIRRPVKREQSIIDARQPELLSRAQRACLFKVFV